MKPPHHARATAPDTRSRLLAITEGMMSARGYEGVSIKDVAVAAGVQTAAVFYHFPSKARLTEAALDAATACLDGQLDTLAQGEQDARERIERFVRNFGRIKQESDTFCFGGVFAAAGGGLPEEVLAATQRFSHAFVRWIAQTLTPLHPERGQDWVETKAQAILALAVGALLASRMAGNPAVYEQIVDASLPGLLAQS